MMRFLTLVGALAVAVPMVSHGQRINARRTGQVAFGGDAASVNRQVGGYRVGHYRQELRDQAPELDGLLTPDFSAIWRVALDRFEGDRGAPASVFNSRFEPPNEFANGIRFASFIDAELPVAAANSVAPIVSQGVVFDQSWLAPSAVSNGLPSQASPEYLASSMSPDATIVSPEPSTYVLMVGGLMAMAVLARRRQRTT